MRPRHRCGVVLLTATPPGGAGRLACFGLSKAGVGRVTLPPGGGILKVRSPINRSPVSRERGAREVATRAACRPARHASPIRSRGHRRGARPACRRAGRKGRLLSDLDIQRRKTGLICLLCIRLCVRRLALSSIGRDTQSGCAALASVVSRGTCGVIAA